MKQGMEPHFDVLKPVAVFACLFLVHQVQGQACQLTELVCCQQLGNRLILEHPVERDCQLLRDTQGNITCMINITFKKKPLSLAFFDTYERRCRGVKTALLASAHLPLSMLNLLDDFE